MMMRRGEKSRRKSRFGGEGIPPNQARLEWCCHNIRGNSPVEKDFAITWEGTGTGTSGGGEGATQTSGQQAPRNLAQWIVSGAIAGSEVVLY